jgi:hypothetical protein
MRAEVYTLAMAGSSRWLTARRTTADIGPGARVAGRPERQDPSGSFHWRCRRWLKLSQMQELTCRAHGALAEPWNKGVGRLHSCGLYAAVEIACVYLRQHGTKEFLGDLRQISPPTVSRIVTIPVPVVKSARRRHCCA